ncbi:MAG: CotH kinase family protein [Propionibacteriaceae bacterium]|nr:CotH kinase family protein [Propionibacteriaceae bacterium]
MKIDKKTNLCGMGSSKKWAFVANHYDKSLLRNTVADYIGSKLTNLAWTPESRPVDLWVNGSYRGSYILIERVAPDTDVPRIPYKALDSNVGVSGADTPGYIMEWDFRKGADKNVTVGSRGYVGLKDPENDYDKAGVNTGLGINQAQVDYINGYLDDCDAKLFGSNFKDDDAGWKSCIDLPSAVDYYIGMELMKPVDGNMWASVYMWKPKGGKLQMGPLWDFDLAAGSANRAGGTVNSTGWYLRNVVSTTAKQSTKTWFNRLNEDSDFTNAVKDRWKVVSEDALKSSDTFLGTQSGLISSSASENFKKWSVTEKLSTVQVVKGGWGKEVTYLRDWLKARIAWMNSKLD